MTRKAPHEKGFVFPLTASLLLVLGLIITVTGNARADSANILPQDIYVVTRTGVSTGSRLCWDWQSTLAVQFTVVRSGEAGTPLYEKTASSDSSEFVVQTDDTYLLLWRNPGNASVALEFTVTVEPGFGSLSLLLLVVAVIIFILIFLVLFMWRGRGTVKREEARKPTSPSNEDIQGGGAYVASSQPPLPIETTPITRGTKYCHSCGNPVHRENRFCDNCGSRLGL